MTLPNFFSSFRASSRIIRPSRSFGAICKQAKKTTALVWAKATAGAAAQKISPQNIRRYAAFHNKETNPHVHIVVYFIDPKDGYLPNTGIERIRSAFANDIYRDEPQNLVSELQNSSCFRPQPELLIPKLYYQIRKSKGKKVYGYLQPNVKKTVDEIVAELAKNPVLKKMYEEWCNSGGHDMGLLQDKPEMSADTVRIESAGADIISPQVISKSAVQSAALTMLKSFGRLIF